MAQIKRGNKFVACWGYDQTQYSIYNVVDVKGRFVFVEGMNGWSGLDANDLAPGSKVKVFNVKTWEQLTPEEQADWSSRGFDRWGYNRHMNDEAENNAPVRTIKKMNRIDGKSWTYVWELDNGQIVRSDIDWKLNQRVKIVQGVKRCLVNEKYGRPSIKIDDVITAHLDTEYSQNSNRYAEQNEYTAYNGR
jgi:hypothetical protein